MRKIRRTVHGEGSWRVRSATVVLQHFVFVRTVTDGHSQHAAALPVQNSIALNIGLAGSPSQNHSLNSETAFDQEASGKQSDDRAVAMGEYPEARRNIRALNRPGIVSRGSQKEFYFVG